MGLHKLAGVPIGPELRYRGLRRGLGVWSTKEQNEATWPYKLPEETGPDPCLPGA